MGLIEGLKKQLDKLVWIPESVVYENDVRVLGKRQGLEIAIDMAEEYQAWIDTEIENEIYKSEDNEDDLSKGYCKGLQKALEIMKGK